MVCSLVLTPNIKQTYLYIIFASLYIFYYIFFILMEYYVQIVQN